MKNKHHGTVGFQEPFVSCRGPAVRRQFLSPHYLTPITKKILLSSKATFYHIRFKFPERDKVPKISPQGNKKRRYDVDRDAINIRQPAYLFPENCADVF